MHEVGVKFETPINPAEFCRPTNADHPEPSQAQA